MGYTTFDKVSGKNGIGVGAKGAEVVVASSTGQLYQSGVAVTSSAAEINALDGLTATVTELNILDGVTASASELNLIDGSVAGTAVASKALVLGASKEIATITTATITTMNAVNIDAGASGSAGSVDVFPTTASKGKLAITAADSAGDTITTIVNASQAAARTYTVPDAGASASFVMTEGAQTLNGVKTFGAIPVLPATGITLGATTISEAEIGVIDAVTAGTASASKAAVLGSSKNLDTLSVATLLATTNVAVGGGTAITKIAVYSQSLDVTSVAANTTAEQTFTVTGLTTADNVFVNKPSLSAGLGIVNARVSAADTLAITFVNATASAIDPAAETYAIVALRS